MAVRITLKRSSIPNKRPTADMLDPGELALNTNALTPGLFFETDNNQVAKVGPTAVGLNPPTLNPSLGELFFDEGDGTLKIGTLDPETASKVWKDISSPFLGGTNGYVVFVAPEFPNSSDAIANDGQAVPFKTLNRAIIEITKESIVQLNESDEGRNNRFTIVVAPGIVPVYNGPGLPIAIDTNDPSIPEFSVNFEGDIPDEPTVLNLQQFNPEGGSLLLPRGTTILGMDLRKTQLRPTYVPTYRNPVTLEGVTLPKTAVIKWTGNSIVSDFSFRDKRSEITVADIKVGPGGEGILISERPHCFGFNDRIYLEYAPGTDQKTPTGGSSVVGNFYHVFPLDVNSFYISFTNLETNDPNFVERSQLPVTPQNTGFLATCYWEPYSHNRLTALFPASLSELDTFYQKVQLAFPKTFSGKANQAEVINPGETQIVAPVPAGSEGSLLTNSTDNSSPYCHNISLRSNYGMCGLEQDGNVVTGFRSALVTQFTVCSLQKDPSAYEIYTTIQDPVSAKTLTQWYPLSYAAWAQLPAGVRPDSPSLVPREAQLELLNRTNLVDIRYYYDDLKSPEGFSYGIPDLEKDFRHFAIRSTNGAYIQVDSGWTIGTAVGFWSLNGGQQTVINSSSNFTQIALRSEGFGGLGSASSGATDPADEGFVISGIRLPQKLIPADTTNVFFYDLGPNILSVRNASETLQEILIGPGFQPINIQPFSLEPNTMIYSRSPAGLYSAAFIDDGLPTVMLRGDGSCILRVRRIDSNFPTGTIDTTPGMSDWIPPFIKRWGDPRNIADASYSLILENTSVGHRDPQVGYILRLNDLANSQGTLRPGVQFDPAQSGGWGRLFQVAFSEASYRGDAPQLNEVLINRVSSNTYYTAFILGDTARPWEEGYETAHGQYVTSLNRNWYAAANDMWQGVYYNDELTPVDQLKLAPGEFNSPWAVSFSSELLTPVDKTYQGKYAPDPRKESYKDGNYYRGDNPIVVNYGFELAYNNDDGSPSVGLLDYKVPTFTTASTTEVVAPLQTTFTVSTVEDFPNPLVSYGVVSLTDSSQAGRIEYAQLLKVDQSNNTITVLRGLYGTEQDQDWPEGTVVTVQGPQTFVSVDKYDKDWAPSKAAMIRFFQIMGYSDEFIAKTLTPRTESFRNQSITTLVEKPEDGYANATGAWPVAFATPSKINCLNHGLHSVGRFLYSKGLPKYLKNDVPVKQYYDYISTQAWGGNLFLTGGDEYGNLPISGEFTQTGTGRPYDTYTSEITDFTRTDAGGAGDEGGGGGGGGGVTAVYTGTGLSGGPIVTEGTITLDPPTPDEIGGVKPGENVVIEEDGTISVNPGKTVGTILSIDFAGGLNGGVITEEGTVSVDTGVGLEINQTTNEVDLVPPTATTIGGIRPGVGLESTPTGVLNLKPSNSLTNTIGGVKQGPGIAIASDGTIGVSSSFIQILDNIAASFDGSRTTFSLSIDGLAFTPKAPQFVLISLGGIIQAANAAYTTSGSTISFSGPPPTGTSFYGIAFIA